MAIEIRVYPQGTSLVVKGAGSYRTTDGTIVSAQYAEPILISSDFQFTRRIKGHVGRLIEFDNDFLQAVIGSSETIKYRGPYISEDYVPPTLAESKRQMELQLTQDYLHTLRIMSLSEYKYYMKKYRRAKKASIDREVFRPVFHHKVDGFIDPFNGQGSLVDPAVHPGVPGNPQYNVFTHGELLPFINGIDSVREFGPLVTGTSWSEQWMFRRLYCLRDNPKFHAKRIWWTPRTTIEFGLDNSTSGHHFVYERVTSWYNGSMLQSCRFDTKTRRPYATPYLGYVGGDYSRKILDDFTVAKEEGYEVIADVSSYEEYVSLSRRYFNEDPNGLVARVSEKSENTFRSRDNWVSGIINGREQAYMNGFAMTFADFGENDENLINYLNSQMHQHPELLPGDLAEMNWAGLAYDAYQNVGLCANNGLMYIKEAALMGSALKEQSANLKSLASRLVRTRGLRTATVAVKAAADMFLSTWYGTRLTAADTRDYREYLTNTLGNDVGLARCQASRTHYKDEWTVVQRYQVYYDNHVDENKLVQEFLARLDIRPTLENAWDMVPYSFVIDWFTDLGTFFESIDNYYHVLTSYKLICEGRSMNATRPMKLDGNPFGCTMKTVEKLYTRAYRKNCTIPVPMQEATPSSFHHWIEGASLLVQKIF